MKPRDWNLARSYEDLRADYGRVLGPVNTSTGNLGRILWEQTVFGKAASDAARRQRATLDTKLSRLFRR